MNHPFTTRFEAPLIACPLGGNSLISTASLQDIKQIIPSDIDFVDNIDILGVAFNAAVINQFNRNDDGLNGAIAAKVLKNFIHKPTNIEHDKTKIVGHIVSAAFSEYEGNGALISRDEAASMEDPFNLSLGAVVYKYADKAFTKLLMRSLDPNDAMYQKVSASWEVGFSQYVIAMGSPNLKDAEVIKNPKHIEEFRKKLKAYGGNGKTKDGVKLYRILTGDIFPLGIGFTGNPAADVKGVIGQDEVEEEQEEVVINDSRDKKTHFDMKKSNFMKKNAAAISQIVEADVKNKKETTMDVEQTLSELKALLVEKKFSEEAVASMTSTFADAIKAKDTEYRESLTKAEQEKVALAAEREELKASVEGLQTQLQTMTQKVTEFEDFKKQEEAVARFNARMEVIDQAYELDDEDRKVVADDIKGLGEAEEAFASYQGKLAVIWRDKNKQAKAALEKSIQERIDAEVAKKTVNVAVASETKSDAEIAEAALEKAQASEAGPSNNNESAAQAEPTLRDKFAKAFSRENVTIS